MVKESLSAYGLLLGVSAWNADSIAPFSANCLLLFNSRPDRSRRQACFATYRRLDTSMRVRLPNSKHFVELLAARNGIPDESNGRWPDSLRFETSSCCGGCSLGMKTPLQRCIGAVREAFTALCWR